MATSFRLDIEEEGCSDQALVHFVSSLYVVTEKIYSRSEREEHTR